MVVAMWWQYGSRGLGILWRQWFSCAVFWGDVDVSWGIFHSGDANWDSLGNCYVVTYGKSSLHTGIRRAPLRFLFWLLVEHDLIVDTMIDFSIYSGP